ncbi:nucleoside deaminase [Agromyces marinus]|uniref:tRNA-specific adenosine deaminase n=1 Tax=Agromyces marinus TaxID=1389020 RepID=A0ABM8H2A4_9MICO|nr:nucleoside deaminase [Agromyces marinus]UIP59968.1 tRNA-specific adenosine deaminase [Agromyces marinus]BDZ54926.1 tRNA-specific adenosine deaminase [Agromyces marinus]
MDATVSSSFSASLPAWLVADLPRIAARPLGDDDERMAVAIELADRNWRAGTGGPFAALVVDAATGELVSAGVNLVLSSGLSSLHAEVTALSLAQWRLGRWDLGADGAELELVVNWATCVMCYGATMWSGVRRLVIAGHGEECERLTGFDEGPMPDDWIGEFARRGIRVDSGTRRAEAVEVFRAFGASDAVVYNARGSGSA